MMPASASCRPEFSRVVPLSRLGGGSFHQAIEADSAEREALARRFDLVALDGLAAAVEIASLRPDLVVLRARFEARFAQRCVVTLDPVAGELSAEFVLVYGPPAVEDDVPAIAGEDAAFEPLHGDAIDIGEAVAQEFSLALPPYPRSPDATAQAAAPADDAGPFAALSPLLGARPEGKP